MLHQEVPFPFGPVEICRDQLQAISFKFQSDFGFQSAPVLVAVCPGLKCPFCRSLTTKPERPAIAFGYCRSLSPPVADFVYCNEVVRQVLAWGFRVDSARRHKQTIGGEPSMIVGLDN